MTKRLIFKFHSSGPYSLYRPDPSVAVMSFMGLRPGSDDLLKRLGLD
jgi:hypothetical protein